MITVDMTKAKVIAYDARRAALKALLPATE